MFKQVLQTSLFVLFSLVLLTSCKYEEGPVLSLQSRDKRVAGVWEVDYATDDAGAENTDSYDSWEFTFEEDGTAELSYRVGGVDVNFEGDWNLIDQDENFQLLVGDPLNLFTSDREYVIERLTRKEFWLRDTRDSMRVLQLVNNL
jgi:hypothetical protein